MTVKLAIIYYSSKGTNYKMAQWASTTAKEFGAEVRLVRVQELAPQAVIDANPLWKNHLEETKHIPLATHEDIAWADAIIFSSPVRFGSIAAQLKQFLDTSGPVWLQGKTVNKVVTAMTSGQNTHGGQEAAILSLYTPMFHWGALVVTPGYTDPSINLAGGNPYGTSVTINPQTGEMLGDVFAAVQHQTKRVLEITEQLKK
ncbi:NAD(P)H:quinone oxidoreductase, type IV [Turicibacter sp. HGF1]|uniref:NAD(P)H:quinone oxidoreductase type IV n=1 Tax=Turicibacter sp. HGF1 TaxID=910310 RepID=UPI0001FDAFA6|nr:NAD(P)H:quinone oxidoreductase type IV [Turicibacter sp. HGF1]EGC93021.1 NAD(P)H:quinone oxidoreductase, type IV [Turicibacter sp. HGF1]